VILVVLNAGTIAGMAIDPVGVLVRGDATHGRGVDVLTSGAAILDLAHALIDFIFCDTDSHYRSSSTPQKVR
jgi:hypothetical protein